MVAAFAVSWILASEEEIAIDQLPAPVKKAIKKRFPKADITAAAKEVDDDETLYEVTLKVDGKTIDVMVEPEGEIELIERKIDEDDLPKAVKKIIESQYPGAKIKSAEEIIEVEGKRETLTNYECARDKRQEENRSEAGKGLDGCGDRGQIQR